MVDPMLDTSARVLVSYTAPVMFLNTASWRQVQDALKAQLPLRNIHWKSASRASIKTILELDIKLVNLETLRDEYASQVPATLLEKPLLNLYILFAEDSDVEGYKNTYKKQIKDWHTTVAARKDQEWLILHITRPDSKAQTGTFFQQLKGSVIEKVRADFNSDKRDRCTQVLWNAQSESPTAWAETINRIREGILFAFDAMVTQREEEVRRSESQSFMPGWNFCTFFILKESLPNSFEGVNLFDEALIQYDQLEASFSHVLSERNMSWFGSFISPGPRDDSAPLLQTSKKPYRDLILANTISVFDLRVYLLARQCELLAKAGKINQINRKVVEFLSGFAQHLRNEDTLPDFFAESWVYSSALSVVEQCDLWILQFPQEGPSLAAFNASKAELLELARHQLDIIGIRSGHLPCKAPFSAAVADDKILHPATQIKATNAISNSILLGVMGDKERFYKLYVDVTTRAIDLYTKGGRRRFALRLHGSLAALDLYRSRLDSAFAVFCSLPAHYAPHMWNSLESFMLSCTLDTHQKLNRSKDSEWSHILLNFLKTYVESHGHDIFLSSEEDKVEYVTRLVRELTEVAATVPNDIPSEDHPILSIRTSLSARLAKTKDGAFLDVIIFNWLPCPLPINDIQVTIAGRDAEKFKFRVTKDSLDPGPNNVTLFCPTSSEGKFLLDTTEVRSHKLLFQINHRKGPLSITGGIAPSSSTIHQQQQSSVSGSGPVASAIAKQRLKKDTPVLITIPQDLLALDVQLLQPTKIQIGQLPATRVKITTGRNNIKVMKVKVSPPPGGVAPGVGNVKFKHKGATIDGDNKANLIPGEDSFTLTDLPENTSIGVILPHTDVSGVPSLKSSVEVDYYTADEPELQRVLIVSRKIITTLPISVNVEDFFKGSTLISKYTVSTTTNQYVRISDAQLVVPEGSSDELKICGSAIGKRGVLTVTPSQSANFLFKLESIGGAVRDPIHFIIKYRIFREEIENLVDDTVSDLLQESAAPLTLRPIITSKLIEALALDSTWVELYRVTGELHIPQTETSEEEEDQIEDLLKKAKEVLSKNKPVIPPSGPWREFIIPLDVPSRTIVATAQLSILSGASVSENNKSLYAGQPISANVLIYTSFHWGESAGKKDRRFALRFDVEEMVRDWLVSGQKRGDFLAADGETYTVPITLVALHHGELALPKIHITAHPLVGESTMGSLAIPAIETRQIHGAERVLILPRGGRSTFVVGMGSS